ncbi:MAG: Fibronectin type III domain protein [Parcubacteria group bacterium GW2011_GWA2_43_17]|nr:MAG: Fibronectin type III domain protein [Parcubacteria group bacterium GW2011_GWA2_43_17]OHB44910.1 MAG: hypothetical protein A2Y13_11130 [Planctomycetes bacterium GWC2_45_44]
MKKAIVYVVSLITFTLATPAISDVYDNFESGVINTVRWEMPPSSWGLQTIYTGSTLVAWSNANGGGGTGSLVSLTIPVPADGYLTLKVCGHDVPDKDGYGFKAAPATHWVEVRGGSSTGPILAKMNPYDNGRTEFKVDARGYWLVVVIGVDNSTQWIGIDDIASTSGIAHTPITNGSLEDGFTGWTVTGTSFQTIAKSFPSWETIPQFASEGGLFASGYMSSGLTGTAISPAITVTRDTLTFDAMGYSGGPWGGGTNEFRLLNASMNVIATIKGNIIPQGTLVNGVWQEKSFNLFAAGLHYGDTCYFQAYDGDSQASYDWIAFDNIRLTGSLSYTYDDFESGPISTGKWDSIASTWGTQTIYTGSTLVAWSDVLGASATGNLVSKPITVPQNTYLNLNVCGHDVPDKDGDGFKAAPETHWVEVRGGNATGPVLAKMNPYDNGRTDFKVDSRDYSVVTVIGVDNSTQWAGMDNVAVLCDRTIHKPITNGSLENGFTGWTVSGTAWKTFAKTKPYWETTPRYGSEGGMFATTAETESLTGTVTSPPIVVTSDTLTFDAAGHSGGLWGGGNNRFELLDSSLNVIATIKGDIGPQGSVQNGAWSERSFDLWATGLNYGDTCYFQAVDGDTGSYGWIAFDNIRQTGISLGYSYDDFESGTLASSKWDSIDATWGLQTIYTGSTLVAWSNVLGSSATGNLVSNLISVPEDGYLTIKVCGHDVPDKDGDGFKTAPETHWAEVRGGDICGPVLAKMNPYDNGRTDFKVDARGYSTVVAVGVDKEAQWIGMDNIATANGQPHEMITNGSLENGFASWTVTGTAWDAFAKTKFSWESVPRYSAEGGLFAITAEDDSLTGTVTSPPIIVKQNFLVFDAAGYSGGPWGGGNNKFNLLDSNLNIIATINGNIGPQGTGQGGTWKERCFDLMAAGLNYGDTCYFQAADGDTCSWGWIAFDNVRQEYRNTLEWSMELAGQNLVNALRPLNQGALPYWELDVTSGYSARYNPGSEFHNIGRVWDALLRLENAIGFEIPADKEATLLSSTQQFFDNSDNLCWTPCSWLGLVSKQFECHSFRENALALNALAEFRGSTWAIDKAPLLAATLSNATDMGDLTGPDYQWIWSNFWYYNQSCQTPYTARFMDPVGSNGRLIEALVYLYRTTGNSSVLTLADQYAAWHLANSTNSNGTLKEAVGLDHTHSYMCTMRGLLLYGELIGGATGQQYIDNVAATYGVSIRNNLIKESGWNPHDWKHYSDNNPEPASAADSAQIACILGRLGHDEYLDDAERLVRCLILPCQIRYTDMPSVLTPNLSDGDQGANPDRYANLDERNVGGFGGMHAPEPYGAKQSTTDVTSSVLHSLIEIYNSIAVHDSNGLRINFHFDYEDNTVKIVSKREKDSTGRYKAVVDVLVKNYENVRIRIPQWAPADSIVLSVNGTPITLVKVGNFAQISAQTAPMNIQLKYSIPVRTTYEKPNPTGTKYQLNWLAGEIAGISPNTNFMPFYKTGGYPPYLTPIYSIQNVSNLGRLSISPIYPDTAQKYDWGGSVIKDGTNSYKMWWCRQDPYDTIWYASSTDGINWTGAQKVMQAADNTYEKTHVGRPSVVKVGSTFYMFYESPCLFTPGGVEYKNQIFQATSTNGTTWTKYPSNSNPQPVITAPSDLAVGAYGIGQPSVFYKDGQFNIYYVCNVTAESPDEIRMARSSSSTSWGSYTTHEVVVYGAAVDVKWNSAMSKYVMAYTIGDWITPNPSGTPTYNVYVFTSSDGRIWNDYTTTPLYQICTNATNATLTGFTNPKTRGYANLVSTDQYGCMNSSTMKVIFMEGTMHAIPGDWKTQCATWDLYSLLFTFWSDVPDQATTPSPANSATDVNLTPTLSWTAGSGTTSHDVYFGTTSPGTFQGNQTGTTYAPGTLALNTTYYWRIDEVGSGSTTTGTVWSFTTAAAPGQATTPSPANSATGVSLTPTLSWTAGSGTITHDVYFGTTSPGTFRGNQAGTSYVPGTLSASTTYYWRIDEVGPGGTTTGTVWNFTTTDPPVPTFVAAGAVASGTGAITPALPAGIATNDILLLFLETSNQAISISNQNGGTWTQVANSPQYCGTAAGTTGARLTVFWSRYNGTQGAPTTSDSGDHQLGRMIAIRGVVASGDPWNVTAGGVEAVSDTSGSIPGATTTVANTLVVTAIATSLPDASSTAKFSAWTNANLTSITERIDNSVTAGNGGGLGVATGVKVTAGVYGNTAVTLANAAYKGMMSIAIKP